MNRWFVYALGFTIAAAACAEAVEPLPGQPYFVPARPAPLPFGYYPTQWRCFPVPGEQPPWTIIVPPDPGGLPTPIPLPKKMPEPTVPPRVAPASLQRRLMEVAIEQGPVLPVETIPEVRYPEQPIVPSRLEPEWPRIPEVIQPGDDFGRPRPLAEPVKEAAQPVKPMEPSKPKAWLEFPGSGLPPIIRGSAPDEKEPAIWRATPGTR